MAPMRRHFRQPHAQVQRYGADAASLPPTSGSEPRQRHRAGAGCAARGRRGRSCAQVRRYGAAAASLRPISRPGPAIWRRNGVTSANLALRSRDMAPMRRHFRQPRAQVPRYGADAASLPPTSGSEPRQRHRAGAGCAARGRRGRSCAQVQRYGAAAASIQQISRLSPHSLCRTAWEGTPIDTAANRRATVGTETGYMAISESLTTITIRFLKRNGVTRRI